MIVLSCLSWHHSHEKRYQALSRFSVLKAIESWVGPRNEATVNSVNFPRSCLQIPICYIQYLQFGNTKGDCHCMQQNLSGFPLYNKDTMPFFIKQWQLVNRQHASMQTGWVGTFNYIIMLLASTVVWSTCCLLYLCSTCSCLCSWIIPVSLPLSA